jgi:hypothetical protein
MQFSMYLLYAAQWSHDFGPSKCVESLRQIECWPEIGYFLCGNIAFETCNLDFLMFNITLAPLLVRMCMS